MVKVTTMGSRNGSIEEEVKPNSKPSSSTTSPPTGPRNYPKQPRNHPPSQPPLPHNQQYYNQYPPSHPSHGRNPYNAPNMNSMYLYEPERPPGLSRDAFTTAYLLSCLTCFFFGTFGGCIAFFLAYQAKSKMERGDFEGARDFLKYSTIISVSSILIASILGIISFTLIGRNYSRPLTTTSSFRNSSLLKSNNTFRLSRSNYTKTESIAA